MQNEYFIWASTINVQRANDFALMNEYLRLLFINNMRAITSFYSRNRRLVLTSRCVLCCVYTCVCPLCVDTIRRFRNDLLVGDQPVAPDRSNLQIAKDRLKTPERIDDLKKRRKTKDGKKRKKKRKRPAKSSSRLPTATRLNETVVSQLDISCFARKSLGKGLIKAPSIEHARPAKYARFVALIEIEIKKKLENDERICLEESSR